MIMGQSITSNWFLFLPPSHPPFPVVYFNLFHWGIHGKWWSSALTHFLPPNKLYFYLHFFWLPKEPLLFFPAIHPEAVVALWDWHQVIAPVICYFSDLEFMTPIFAPQFWESNREQLSENYYPCSTVFQCQDPFPLCRKHAARLATESTWIISNWRDKQGVILLSRTFLPCAVTVFGGYSNVWEDTGWFQIMIDRRICSFSQALFGDF